MSRLDSFIRRMCAQRDILNALVPVLQGVEGMVLEFGLGSGRTYDHLRERFPARRIVVFERDARIAAHADPRPAELVAGDIRETAMHFPAACAALVHADIDTGHLSADEAELLTWLPETVVRLLAPGGVVASSISLSHPRLRAMSLPETVEDKRYYLACLEPQRAVPF